MFLFRMADPELKYITLKTGICKSERTDFRVKP